MNKFEMRDRPGNQDIDELTGFLTFINERGVKRYLEVGCRNGDTFFAVMKAIGKDGVGLAIDKTENPTSHQRLSDTIKELTGAGISCDVVFGDSTDPAVIRRAAQEGPFDLILIDGDHTFEGVSADWRNYSPLGTVIALHDISAPDDHFSDGKPNGVGRFWRELAPVSAKEIVTPGSMMGFGLVMQKPAAIELEVEPIRTPPIVIAIPAWSPTYIDLAVKYTVPATIASLDLSPFRDVTFLITTDDAGAWQQALDVPAKERGWKVEYEAPKFPPPGVKVGRHMGHWAAFVVAHKDALNRTPIGSIAALLNSDIVVSRETFSVVAKAIETKNVVVSVGIRTAIDHAVPPIGASADELFRWIWDNPHSITKECIWGSGKSDHPTILFFEDDEGVTMHAWHLTPMFIKRDRALAFNGTIDDDLLASYGDDEIHFMKDGEAAFAELSPDNKTHPTHWPLSVDVIMQFGGARFSKSHVRNFAQRMRVLGNPTKNHPAADEILRRFGR